MDDVGLANYVAGVDRRPVEAGRLDAECSRLLGVHCGTPIFGRRQNLLDFWWLKEREGYFLVLKATVKREIFVQTFHRIHLREARRLYRLAVKQGRLIRAQIGTFLDSDIGE